MWLISEKKFILMTGLLNPSKVMQYNLKKLHKDIQPHFSLSWQDSTFSSSLPNSDNLSVLFSMACLVSRPFSYCPIYPLTIVSSASMSSTAINMLIVKIHVFNTNLILTSQPIFLRWRVVWVFLRFLDLLFIIK